MTKLTMMQKLSWPRPCATAPNARSISPRINPHEPPSSSRPHRGRDHGWSSVVGESNSSPFWRPMSLFRPRQLLIQPRGCQSQETKNFSSAPPSSALSCSFYMHRSGICKLDMCAASFPWPTARERVPGRIGHSLCSGGQPTLGGECHQFDCLRCLGMYT